MKRAEDIEKGIMAIDTGDKLIKWARAKYCGTLKCFKPDSVVYARDYIAFPTKKAATQKCKNMGWPTSMVEKFGTRFGVAWGIRHDLRDNYFLAEYE